MNEQPRWERVCEDVIGLHFIEVGVNPGEFPYPATVQIEAEGGTVLAEDAKRYALTLLAAAEEADAQNDAMVAAARAKDGCV
jgi:hypothetical protein